MRIAVGSAGKEIDSEMDPRFGRAPWLLLVDPETMEFEAVENSQNAGAAQGAGIRAASMMPEKKVVAVIAGRVGPKAVNTLQAAGIAIVEGIGGTVRQAVSRYASGEFSGKRK